MSSQVVPLLIESRRRACARFRDWVDETDRARARVEAAARSALAECYYFATEAFAQPDAFEALCRRLGIRETRRDRADNAYIRVVKTVFGREAMVDGHLVWESIGDSRINKYATILRYADARSVAVADLETWLSRDHGRDGRDVAMSLSRRLAEARMWFAGPAALPPPVDGDALAEALRGLPPSVDVRPLELRGLGAPQEASVILSLGEEEGQAVRLSNLPPSVLIAVLATIRRAVAPTSSGAGGQSFGRLADILSGLRFVWRGGGVARVVNHADHCAILVSGAGGILARVECRRLDGIPNRRVLAFDEAALGMFVGLMRGGTGETFDLANLARPGGVLAHQISADAGAEQRTMMVIEVPDGGDPGWSLTDFAFPDDALRCALGSDDLAGLVRLDRGARGWRQVRPSGRVRRASRLVEVDMDDTASRLFLRRGAVDGVALPLMSSRPRQDRLTRADLGAAARLLLARDVTDDAQLRVVPGVLWVLSGTNRYRGEAFYIGLPARDAKGRVVRTGGRDARFCGDTERFSEAYERRFGCRSGKY